jgi:SH3-like domain-containing protein
MRWGLVLFGLLWAVQVEAQTFPQPASLKRNEVNVRAGPGTRYPILWVFQRKGWPVQLLAKYDNWYKIRDIEGEEGWAYVGMVSQTQTAVVSAGPPLMLFKGKNEETLPVYRLGPGVVVELESCGEQKCKVSVRGSSGWVLKNRLVQVQ